jgi:hypothetical protein
MLPLLMTGMSALGTITSLFGNILQGKQARNAKIDQAMEDAATYRFNAYMSRLNAALEVEDKKHEYGRLEGKQRAAMSSSGLASNTGSYLEVLADQAHEAAKDTMMTTWRGEVEARLNERKALLAEREARRARKSGGGWLSAASTLLGGATQAAGIYKMFSR